MAARPRGVDHLVWHGSIGAASGDWACLHCGACGGLPWGSGFTALASFIDALVREHRGCKKPDVPPYIPSLEAARERGKLTRLDPMPADMPRDEEADDGGESGE